MTSLQSFPQDSAPRKLRAPFPTTHPARLQTVHWLLRHQRHLKDQPATNAGFTLLELLVVLLMVTVLMAIGAPVWLSMADGQRLGAVQDTTFQALRLAQAKARQQKRIWEACFRVDSANTRVVQYSVHPAVGDKCGNANWQPLGAEAATFTTIDSSKPNLDFTKGGTAYVVQFNANGWLASAQDSSLSAGNDKNTERRISFKLAGRPDLNTRTCVYVETLLGSLRAARDASCDSP